MILTPAYGRDYKSKAAVQKAMDADLDFNIQQLNHQYDGKPVNRPQLRHEGYVSIQVRYDNLRKSAMIEVKP